MLNGRNHSAARKGLIVNGHGSHALNEADSSALYGDYEQKLATELAQLLKSGSPPRLDTAPGSSGQGARSSLPPPPPLPSAKSAPATLVDPSALLEARPGAQRSFVPAAPPDDDFSAMETQRNGDALPFSWRHEPRPPQPSWLARQMKAGILGLGAGLIVVLPAVAVLSGRFDTVLPGRKPAVSERAPRLYEVPITPPKAAMAQAAVAPAPAALTPRIETVTAVRQPIAAPVSAELPEKLEDPVRSVGSVEAFPPASGQAAVKPSASAALAAVTPTPPVKLADEAADLLALGKRLVKDGDIAGARTPLARAANLGNSEALLALGETFDPNMLAAWGALDAKSDASTARLYYGRAVAAGQPRAKARLEALN